MAVAIKAVVAALCTLAVMSYRTIKKGRNPTCCAPFRLYQNVNATSDYGLRRYGCLFRHRHHCGWSEAWPH